MAGRLENRDASAAASDVLKGYGLDDWQMTSGWLLNAGRADGVRAPKVRAFLAYLHAHGLTHQGKTYQVSVGVDGGQRTAADQLRLYSQGRQQLSTGQWVVVDASKVVTNARTLSETNHSRGRAVDLWVMLNGAPLLFPHQAPALFEGIYLALGELGESMGLEWGGRWSSIVDRPHFEDSSFILPPATVSASVIGLVLLIAAGLAALSK